MSSDNLRQQHEGEQDNDEKEEDEELGYYQSTFFFPTPESRYRRFFHRSQPRPPSPFPSISNTFDIEAGWDFLMNNDDQQSSSSVRYTPLLSLFENLFSNQLDRLILDEVSSESMQTYHQELLRRDENVHLSPRYQHIPFDSASARNEQCFICMEPFTHNENLVLLDCRHLYHPPCIENAIMYNPQCPLCKTPIECSSIRRSEPPS